VNGGVYQVNVPRAEPITEHGMQIPPSMGLATAINFQPTGGGKAAITGDFVMLGSEVNPVIRALLVPALMRLLGPANWWMPSWAETVLFVRRERLPKPARETS
jgi:hypothetical protein